MHEDARRRLLGRLDEIGSALARRGDALALLGLGSVGRDLDRLDEHSDLDFFVVVDDGAKPAYLASIDWLEDAHPVVYSFANTSDGRKALFDDGIFAEYAIFTLDELATAPYAPGRVVWQRADAPAGLDEPRQPPPPATHGFTYEHQANEALTNLYVGLHRDARGERLSGARLIQVHAIDRLIGMLELEAAGRRQDVYAAERGAERRFGDALPLTRMIPGYGHNADAALAILEWLEEHADVDPTLAAAVRDLAHALA